MKKIIGFLMLFFSFCLIGYGIFLYYYNPKRVILTATNEVFNDIKNKNINVKKSSIFTDIKIQNKNELFNFNGDLFINNNPSRLYFNYKLNNNKYEFSLEDKKIYFDLYNFISNKYLNIADENLKKIEQNEFNIFLDEIYKSFDKNISDEFFVRKKEIVNINKVDYDCYKYTVTFTYDSLFEVISTIFTSVKNNTNLKNIYSILFSQYNEKDYLSNLKRQIIGDNSGEAKDFDISVYMSYTNKPLKIDVVKYFYNSSNITTSKFSFSWIEKSLKLYDLMFIYQNDNKNIFELTINQSKNDNEVAGIFKNVYYYGTLTKDYKSMNLNLFNTSDKNNVLGNIVYEYVSDSGKVANIDVIYNDFSLKMKNTFSNEKDIPSFSLKNSNKVNFDFILDQINKLYK